MVTTRSSDARANAWIAALSLDAAGLAGAYGLYAEAAVVSVPLVWAAAPETTGKTLEQM